MKQEQEEAARKACEALCKAYGPFADAGDADGLAHLYAVDGVFDRLGQVFEGREAIRGVITGRPPGLWTEHHCRDIRIEIDADGRSAQGTAQFEMRRGRAGVTEIEHLRGEYQDRYTLTEEGWRFARRKAILKG
jgi:ketosteroid isomerase-like protein